MSMLLDALFRYFGGGCSSGQFQTSLITKIVLPKLD